MVCLMASTSGSSTASRRNCTTGSKLSKGWCSSTSPGAQPLEDRLPARQAGLGQAGSCAGSAAPVGASAWSISWFSRTRLTGPLTLYSAGSAGSNCSSRKSRQLRRAAAHHLQPDGLAEVPRCQPAAQRLAQVGHVVLVDLEVGVARDAELREGLDRAARKQLAQVGADHAGQQHEALAAAAQLVGQADHARQHARHLDDGDRVVAPEGVARPGGR
jgi:hypothetical protein